MSKQNSMNDLASAMSLNVHKEESSETDIRSENKFETQLTNTSGFCESVFVEFYNET